MSSKPPKRARFSNKLVFGLIGLAALSWLLWFASQG
jgi:hypothetical protein